jgi:hypothetical protein
VKQEKEFWMDQCQKQEAHQQQQTSEVDVQPLNAQIESLQKEKDHLLQVG